jgi:hypothetical protein
LRGELLDPPQRHRGGGAVRRDTINRATQHQLFGVGGITGEEEERVVVLDDDRQMAGRVAGRGNEMNVTRLGQVDAVRKRPEGG